MKASDFKIGDHFKIDGQDRLWLVTDVGSRVLIAIIQREMPDLMKGPPYVQEELVFDEHDFPVIKRIA